MSLTKIEPPTDHIANACSVIDNKYLALLHQIAQTLDESIALIDRSDNFTPAEFWERLGSTGATLITALGTWRGILQTYAPELVTQRLAAAGSTLTVDSKGIVSIK